MEYTDFIIHGHWYIKDIIFADIIIYAIKASSVRVISMIIMSDNVYNLVHVFAETRFPEPKLSKRSSSFWGLRPQTPAQFTDARIHIYTHCLFKSKQGWEKRKWILKKTQKTQLFSFS